MTPIARDRHREHVSGLAEVRAISRPIDREWTSGERAQFGRLHRGARSQGCWHGIALV